ncbi:MAG: hypothetical protein H6Q68_2688 [Firmicutes bacterium]|nr:hypothetical protein [Bacillota bacterium]
MICPLCGASSQFDFLYCPNCKYKMILEAEQPLPNWRQLPGFRSKTSWKMLLAVILYIWIFLAIVASLFSGF